VLISFLNQINQKKNILKLKLDYKYNNQTYRFSIFLNTSIKKIIQSLDFTAYTLFLSYARLQVSDEWDASQKLNIVFCLHLNVYWCGFIYECHFFRPKYGEYFFAKTFFQCLHTGTVRYWMEMLSAWRKHTPPQPLQICLPVNRTEAR